MQQQQLRFSQTRTKRTGDTLHNDWKNNFSQLISTILYQKYYNNKNFVHNCAFHFWTLRFMGPLDTGGPLDDGPAAPRSRGAWCRLSVINVICFQLRSVLNVVCYEEVHYELMWSICVRRNFSRGKTKLTFCLSFSGWWRCNANGRSQNALPFQHHKQIAPCYGNSPKMHFFGSNASFSLMFLFTPYKTTWLIAINSYCLSAFPAELPQMSAFNSRMRQNTYRRNFLQKWTFVAMWWLRNKDQY